MNPRIPSILHPLLHEYTRRIDRDLPVLVTGFYLEGSLALGSFQPRLSDIDFVAVLNRQVSGDEFAKLEKVHRRIEQTYPQWKMSGRYLQTNDLGCRADQVQPHPSCHDGKLLWANRFELSAVTWFILKEHGIPIFGPPPETLGFTVEIDYLLQTQLENLNSYWADWTRRPPRLLALLSDWSVQWTVLGVLRQFYTFRERGVVSKTAAGKYALACLPGRWHRIIQEAIALRGDAEFCSDYGSRLERALDTYRFLRYVIRTCNAIQTPS